MDTILAAEYPTPFVRTPRGPCSDDWKPPKLAGKRHPFHPDVRRYCRRSGARVHWVVPVHGPVVLPGWGDPIAGGRTPFTSRGEINGEGVPDSTEGVERKKPEGGKGGGEGEAEDGRRKEKARPVLWTPALLAEFAAALVQLQHEGRYGRLRIAPSGPTPDPFLPASRSVVPARHAHVRNRRRPRGADGAEPPVLAAPDEHPPVGVECGDHLRLYVDAHRALSLRTWLAHWHDGHLAKCRLALVAPSGECLIVA